MRYRVMKWVHHHVTGERAAQAAGAFAVCPAQCCRRRWQVWRALDSFVLRTILKKT